VAPLTNHDSFCGEDNTTVRAYRATLDAEFQCVYSVGMAKQKENPNRVITFLTDKQMAVLKKISAAHYGAPMSALVRQAVEEFCQKHRKS
jgi:hypothetical protein